MRQVFEPRGGIAPRFEPSTLPEGAAIVAVNTRFDRGGVSSVYKRKLVTGVTIPNGHTTIHRKLDDAWVTWAGQVDVVRGPVTADVYKRVYVAGPTHGYPSVFSEVTGQSFRLGIPVPTAPTAVPSVPVNGSDPDSLLVAETIFYAVAFRDAWGQLGPLSSASASVDRERDTDVSVTLPAFPAGNYNFGAGAAVELYRSNSGASGVGLQLVGSFAAGTTVLDVVDNAALGRLATSTTWIGPPDDNGALYPDGPLVGIAGGDNGVLAGWAGRSVWFSEPFFPHAWPASYRIAFRDPVVAVAELQQGWVILTTGGAHIISGAMPESYSDSRIDFPQGCVARRSVVRVPGGVMFACPDGLVLVSGNGFDVVTAPLIDRDKWQTLVNFTTLTASLHEDTYVASFVAESVRQTVVFDAGTRTLSTRPSGGECFFHDPEADALFFALAGALYSWEDPTNTTGVDALEVAVWRSAEAELPRVVPLRVVRVQATIFPVRVRIVADGIVKYDKHVYEQITGFAGLRARKVSVEVQFRGVISGVAVASSRAELV